MLLRRRFVCRGDFGHSCWRPAYIQNVALATSSIRLGRAHGKKKKKLVNQAPGAFEEMTDVPPSLDDFDADDELPSNLLSDLEPSGKKLKGTALADTMPSFQPPTPTGPSPFAALVSNAASEKQKSIRLQSIANAATTVVTRSKEGTTTLTSSAALKALKESIPTYGVVQHITSSPRRKASQLEGSTMWPRYSLWSQVDCEHIFDSRTKANWIDKKAAFCVLCQEPVRNLMTHTGYWDHVCLHLFFKLAIQ